MDQRLPGTTADITPELLTALMREHGTIDAATSVATAEADAMAAGIGFMGEVGKMHVTYDGGDGPAVVIAKVPTQSAEVRAMLAPARVFEREARFYQELAPSLGDLVPATYGVGIDLENDDYLLLIEDLSAMTEGDQLAGASPDQAAAALDAVAALHAKFWGGADLAGLDWMPDNNADSMKIGEQVYAASLPGFQEAFAAAIDPANQELIERFGANVPQLLDRHAAMPTTLSHFDYRLDNLFFADDGTAKMIDFQASSRGGFMIDVGYFVSQNMSIEDRRANEDDLLRGYHARLTADGAEYDLDQLRHDYRIGVLYGWIIPVFAVGTLDFTSERAVGLWTNVVERMQAALLDHNCIEFLTL